MALIANRILSRYPRQGRISKHNPQHEHVLSYAFLDHLLDYEEHELAQESGVELEEANDAKQTRPTTDSATQNVQQPEGEEHPSPMEEVELKEAKLDDLQTIKAVEEYITKHHRDITGVDDRQYVLSPEQVERMTQLLSVNCIHKGDLEGTKGKRWLVAIDGSAASRRAWLEVREQIGPQDHIMVVTIRDKNLPKQFALSTSDILLLRFELWMSARHITHPYVEELAASMDPSRYSVMIAEAWDVRHLLCNLAKRYGIDVICLGQHSKEESTRHWWQMRSFHSYLVKHACCQVKVF